MMIKLVLFLTIATLLTQVYAQNNFPPSQTKEPVNATRTKIEDTISENCVKETAKWTEIPHGMSFECDSKPQNNRRGHHVFTDMNLDTSEGFFSPNRGSNGWIIPGETKSIQFVGCVDSVWETFRCAFFNRLETVDKVVAEPKICSSDGAFCFENDHDTCVFYFANLSWRQNCPNLQVIDLMVTENLYKE